LTIYSKGSIEEAQGMLQVDFCNASIGGGVLSGGCVQEEILFSFCPELIAVCLFTSFLMDNESLLICGSERFSNYQGYAVSLKYAGDFQDPTPRELDGTVKSTLVAIDATDYRYGGKQYQYKSQHFLREINKAYCGFFTKNSSPSAVATGNWGCGAFLGDASHKSIVQLVAASECQREMVYYTFGNEKFSKELDEIYKLLKNSTVGYLWKLLEEYEKSNQQEEFFQFIRNFVG